MANALSGFQLILETPADADKAIQDAKPADGDFSMYGGFTTKSLTLNATEIDVTSDLSSENRELLDGHGIKSFDVSGSGFLQDGTTAKAIEANVLTQRHRWFRLKQVDNTNRVYTAKFKISNYSFDGEVSGAVNFSITLMSSGAIEIG